MDRPAVRYIRRLRRDRCGITLAELMMSVVIMSIVLGVISVFYYGCLEAWRRGAVENAAEQKVAWAYRRLTPDVRLAMQVTPDAAPYTGYGILLRLPAQTYQSSDQTYFNQVAVNAMGNLYLVGGDYVHYYRGNDAAQPDVSGAKLWRALTHADGSAGPTKLVIDNLQDNPVNPSTGYPRPLFIYYPDIFSLKSIEVNITVRETMGNKSATVHLVHEIAIRNK